MVFNSIEFLVFFPIALFGYYVIPKKVKYIWLLGCSYYFYMAWNPGFSLLIFISTLITYAGGRLVDKYSDNKKRKLYLVICIVLNLAILFYFKYTNFFFECIYDVSKLLHINMPQKKFDILLPVGISFYTFQALGYLIDVYRKKLPAEKNFLMYALFVSFFPQLVAGPIERSTALLSQLNDTKNKKPVNYKLMGIGFANMVFGMFMKIVIADRAAILVNTIFDQYYLYGAYTLIFGVISFSLQIYCDFASYSTIAIGTANMLGIELMENFNTPYLACSIKDFWRRWHISLSSWLKDYVYIPLGGNRCSRLRHYLNIFITFLLSGLWHGASFGYVAWGALHGFYQIIGDIIQPVRKKIIALTRLNTECFSYRLWEIIRTFALTGFAWIFFRADNIASAIRYIVRMFSSYDPWVLFSSQIYTLGLNTTELGILSAATLFLIVTDLLRYKKKQTFAAFLSEQNAPFRIIVLLILIMTTLIYGAYGTEFNPQAFIYFQF